MCSMAVADEVAPLTVGGLVLMSYPWHTPNDSKTLRTEHLPRVRNIPTLAISGDRDPFGTPAELKNAFELIQGHQVTLHILPGKGHDLKGGDADISKHIRAWLNAV